MPELREDRTAEAQGLDATLVPPLWTAARSERAEGSEMSEENIVIVKRIDDGVAHTLELHGEAFIHETLLNKLLNAAREEGQKAAS